MGVAVVAQPVYPANMLNNNTPTFVLMAASSAVPVQLPAWWGKSFHWVDSSIATSGVSAFPARLLRCCKSWLTWESAANDLLMSSSAASVADNCSTSTVLEYICVTFLRQTQEQKTTRPQRQVKKVKPASTACLMKKVSVIDEQIIHDGYRSNEEHFWFLQENNRTIPWFEAA